MLETVNRQGMTPLILAAQKGNVPVVQALLHCGVELCFSSEYGYTGTALLQAAHYGHVHVVKCIFDFYQDKESVCDCWHLSELID